MILIGNSLLKLKEIANNSVDCIITSPPYYYLRDYGDNCNSIWDETVECEHKWNEENFCIKCNAWYGQLGLEPTVDLYIKHLADIFDECKRVLKKTGNLFINIGDSYSTFVKKNYLNTGKYTYINKYIQDEQHPFRWFTKKYHKKTNKNNTKMKKQLLLVPYRLAIELQNRGWIIRDIIIWAKKVYYVKENKQIGNGMPESVKDRLTKSYEVIIHATKSDKYYFNKPIVNKQQNSISRFKQQNCISNFLSESKSKSKFLSIENDKNKKLNIFFSNKHMNVKSIVFHAINKVKECDKLEQLFYEAVQNINLLIYNKMKEKNLTVKDLENLTGIPAYLINHYIRTDITSALLPSSDAWDLLSQVLDLPPYETVYKEEYKQVIDVVSPYAYAGNVWFLNPEANKMPHFALMPETLVDALINMGCPIGGVVLDPFAGAGTVPYIAEKTNRKWIAIEINQKYVKLIEQRLKGCQKLLFV